MGGCHTKIGEITNRWKLNPIKYGCFIEYNSVQQVPKPDKMASI